MHLGTYGGGACRCGALYGHLTCVRTGEGEGALGKGLGAGVGMVP